MSSVNGFFLGPSWNLFFLNHCYFELVIRDIIYQQKKVVCFVCLSN